MDPAFAAAYPSRPAYSLDHGKPARFIGLGITSEVPLVAIVAMIAPNLGGAYATYVSK